jgi:O-antigen biosynthesis protein WbqP
MKRAFDLIAATLGVAVLWPLIVIAMAVVRLTSSGSAIFAHTRVGWRCRPFTLYKLRTMYLDTKQVPSHNVDQAALTPAGKFLRRTKLDELPQLFNVLKGDMSLVGPRPCLPSQTELIELRLREGAMEVLPGITGLAQVRGLDMSDPVRLAAVDGQYVRSRTFAGDLWLLVQTVAGSGLGLDAAKRQAVPGRASDAER